ncbi:MAG: HupE/UreJ family protein, partial [Pseudomonadota bacterium]
LRETQTGTFIESWTFSSALNVEAPEAVYPDHCVHEPPRITCGDTGLRGALTIERLGERYSAAVVRITPLGESTQTFTLTAAQPVANLNGGEALPWTQVASSYVPLGFEHILLGVDHLMFVLCLVLLVQGVGMLVKTITAFTVAHSLTLAAATFGWLGVPEGAVNACIALSIAYVAADVIQMRRGHGGLSVRYPWGVAFAFGLLHGFGFAGALTGIGLPAANLPTALLFFNIGVELGQLAFVTVVLLLFRAHRVLTARGPAWTETAAMYAMGTIAMFWFLSRLNVIVNPLLSI